MSVGQTASQFVERLLQEARASRVSEEIIQQRRRLFELSCKHPEAVLAFCQKAPKPQDARTRELFGHVCEVAARAQFERGLVALA
jgi:hypothetical protein